VQQTSFAAETKEHFRYIRLKLIKNMKKILGIFALSFALVSCGSGSSNSESTVDSTAVQVDSLAVTANDSTTAQIPTEEAPAEPVDQVK